MSKSLDIQIRITRKKLSPTSIQALQALDRYDLIVFTSKNARKCFSTELRERGICPPAQNKIIHVGPRADVLKHAIDTKRILFPRSAIAPFDIVRDMRKRGALVRVLPLYFTSVVPLSDIQHKTLLTGGYTRITFKSSSGVTGLLKQLRATERRQVLKIKVECIGQSTAKTAREAGFKRISIMRI